MVRRLCEHLTTVFERAERSWSTIPSSDWLAAYEPDLDNLRAALGWSLGPDGDAALGLNLSAIPIGCGVTCRWCRSSGGGSSWP